MDKFGPGFFLLPDQGWWRLKVHAGGWRARRHARHYSMTSIPVLFHYLLGANADNGEQQERLLTALRLVTQFHREGKLRSPTDWTKVVTVAAEREFGELYVY